LYYFHPINENLINYIILPPKKHAKTGFGNSSHWESEEIAVSLHDKADPLSYM